MTPADLDYMLCNDGAYVLADPRYPTATSVVIVMGARHNEQGLCVEEGRMFMLEPKYELSKNPDHWRELSTHLCGGPFSVSTIEAANDEVTMLDHDVEVLSGVVERCRSMIPAFLELMKGIGRQDEALKAQQVMSDIDALLEARKNCRQIFSDIPKAPPLP